LAVELTVVLLLLLPYLQRATSATAVACLLDVNLLAMIQMVLLPASLALPQDQMAAGMCA